MEVRQKLLARGIQLEVISMAWMAIEFVLGVSAGIHAGSILLIAFGLDAFLETVAGGILIWRLRAEYNGADAKTVARVERTASRLVLVHWHFLLFRMPAWIMHLIHVFGW
ncbi:hypothetical protein [Weissella confusa]|uniref:hypothetical protein n=1 Tax=Weissella confusa TaxID=1583 RepID=UPI001FD9D7A6|nr:hypothetical protein [Weissella confusa]